jgi:outer membrane receptor protein involved in Fe transport
MLPFKYTKPLIVTLFVLRSLNISAQSNSIQTDTLHSVIISASRYEQRRESLPVSVTTISGDELQRQNLSVDKAIERTAGVAIVDGEIQIRGSSGWSYGAGSRVAVILDGLPLLSGDALRPSWGLVPNEAVGQIELVKGPASVQYGSSALSGVLHAQTMWPSENPFTRINLMHGAYSAPKTEQAKYWNGTLMESTFNILHSRKIKQWDLVFSLNGRGADGYLGPMPDSAGNYQSKYNPFTVDKFDASKGIRTRVAARYHFKKVEGLTIGAALLCRYSESVGTLLWANDTTGLYQSFAGATTPGQQLFLMSDAWIDYRVSPMLKHQFKYRWLHVDNGFENNRDSYTNNHTIDYSAQLRLDSIGLKGVKIIPGFYTTQVQSQGGLYIARDSSGYNTSSNCSVFAQAEKKLWDKLNLSAGWRYEEYKLNDHHFSKPVWRGGANFEWNSNTFLRANYGQGFRFPTIAERYTKTSVSDFYFHPNPNLQPESSESYEVGIIKKWKIGKVDFDFDAAVFRQQFENYIEYNFGQWQSAASFSDLATAFGFKTLNTGTTRIDGLESTLHFTHSQINTVCKVMISYSFSQPVALEPSRAYGSPAGTLNPALNYLNTSSDTTGFTLKYRIKHMARCQIYWNYKKWNASVTGRYNSFMGNIDEIFEVLDEEGIVTSGISKWREEHNKGDLLFDLSLAYEISKKLQTSLFVFNVLNYEYMSRPLQIEPGRNFQMRISLTIT